MSIFSTILQKLGIEKAAPPASQATTPAQVAPSGRLDKDMGTAPAQTQDRFVAKDTPVPSTSHVGYNMTAPPSAASGLGAAPVVKPPAEMPMVDVMSKLSKLAHDNPQKLDWKVSIVDLLKLLGIDSSYNARKELAVELGCPADLMHDSASMNTWLHKTVLQKIAQNGGNIPKELLD